MQNLSRVLTELYDLAEQGSVRAFPHQLLEVLGNLVPFDGAAFGTGNLGLREFEKSGYDGTAVLSGARDENAALLAKSQCDNCAENCMQSGVIGMQAHHHQEEKILLNAPAGSQHPYWLALCRRGRRFQADDKEYLAAVWPHVLRGLEINRQRFLAKQLRWKDTIAAAVIRVIDGDGRIDIAEPGFTQLLASEWPHHTGWRLPSVLMESWRTGRPYLGTKIEIRFHPQDDCLLCIARPCENLAGLTKTERLVARHFASGLKHKEIAQILDVSENTVRTHLKQAYSKLGVHDKAQLANRLAPSGREQSTEHAAPLQQLSKVL